MIENDPDARRAKRIELLKASRTAAKLENEEKIRSAYLKLETERKPLTVAGIARIASVSRDTVYSSRYWEEIKSARERTKHSPVRSHLPAMQTEASLRRRLQEALEDVNHLRAENKQLKADLLNVIVQLHEKSKP